MKYRITACFAAVVVVFLISVTTGVTMGGRSVHAQSASSTIPFLDGLQGQSSETGVESTFVRQTNGTYVNLQFSTARPFSLMSPLSTVTGLLADGLKNLAAAPAGPAGVGLQSQTYAIGYLAGTGGIALALGGGSVVEVYQVTAALAFQGEALYDVGQDVNSLSFADFNGDGNVDLAVAYDGAGTPGGIAILLNQGNGTFAKAVTYASGTPATRFAVLDLNHDGHLDIATISIDSKVTVLLGKGDGTFGSPVQYPATGGSNQAIAIADVNGDGNPDLVIGGTTGILLGNGDGTFHPGSPLPKEASTTFIWAYAAGDMNGDGKMDLVYADIQNQVAAPLFGNGSGTFQAGQAYALSQFPDSLVLTDYNNDGRLDIVNGGGDQRVFSRPDQSGDIDILLNNGDGTFQGAPAYFTIATSQAQSSGYFSSTVTGIASAKFGGQFPGLLASGFDGGLTLLLGNGKGGFQSPQSLPIQGGQAIAAADFNGDGIGDAAVSQGSNGIAILLGTSSGLGAPVMVSTGGVTPAAIVTGDFNGDGKIDLAVVGQEGSGGALSILLGNGDGTFAPAVTTPAGATPTSMSVADINGDGKLDLVFADSGPDDIHGAVYVLLNAGGGTFQTPASVFSGQSPAFALGDVNGDGKLDLIAAAAVGEGNSKANWLEGNGNGTFQAPVAIVSSDSNDNALLLQDFNGDGKLDLIIAHQDSGESGGATYLAGNGNGTFSAETELISSPAATQLLSTDLNGDGKPDLLVAGLTIAVLIDKPVSTTAIVSAANPSASELAPGSLATAYGKDLANSNAGGASLPLPTEFGGTSISILDSSGAVTAAPLLYVIPTQVNFEVPPGVATGPAQVTVKSGDGTQSVASVQIAPVAPGLFELNSTGLAAAYVIVYHANNTQTVEQVYTVTGSGAIVSSPVSLGSSTDQPYLFLFGTGFEAAGTAGVKVSIAGTSIPVAFAGPQGGFVGLDQANVQLPASLAGAGNVTIELTANGIAANAVNITFQ